MAWIVEQEEELVVVDKGGNTYDDLLSNYLKYVFRPKIWEFRKKNKIKGDIDKWQAAFFMNICHQYRIAISKRTSLSFHVSID